MRDSYVYAVRFGQYVKIGTSTNPAERLRALKSNHRGGTLHPRGLTEDDVQPMFAVAGDERTEHVLHTLFDSNRVIGEWYNWTPEMDAWAQRLPDRYRWPFMSSVELRRITRDADHDDYVDMEEVPAVGIPDF